MTLTLTKSSKIMKFLSSTNKIIRAQFVRFKSSKKEDPCECPKPPPKQGMVEEKSCTPCSFWTWKPKPRECLMEEIQHEMERKKTCCASMNIKPPAPTCKPEDICPFTNKPGCKGPEKAQLKMKDLGLKDNIPAADWDVDC